MANVSNIRPFIQKWEGGLSRNTNDKASINPAPWTYKGLNGWHTNKGVTYTTFVGLATKLGYALTADNFFTMPDKIWDAIFKNGYWNTWYLDDLKSQAIADLIVDFCWGSGANGSFQSIRKYLATKNITVASRFEAVKELNKLAFFNEETIFTELVKHREQFFRSLNQPTFLNGWLNRLNSLNKFGLDAIAKKKIKLIIGGVLLLIVIGSTIFYLLKRNK